jgi:undecaprenyl-diphosphatase
VSDLTYVQSVVLGVVEGLTEFLPVSSTGHLTITEGLMGLKVDDPAVTSFTAVIQLGAIVATFIYFWRDISRLALAWVRGLLSYRKGAADADRTRYDYRLAWFVIIGSIPVGVVGFVLKPLITGPLRSLWVVAIALVAWSVVMVVAERRATQQRGEDDLHLLDVLVIGVMQCFALVPGVSRSGATISAGLLRGLDRVTATRLSFFLAIPALTAAGLYELKDVDTKVVGYGQLGVGTAVSFVVAFASIAWLLRFVQRHPITVFVWYRVALGVALAVLLGVGALSAT